MDEKRQRDTAYEYLCHLEEAKQWMEACLHEVLPPTTELEEGLRNGVYLAKLGNFFAPRTVPIKKIYDSEQTRYKATGLEFRHTDNIIQWINAMTQKGLPMMFYPETTDIYDKKNMPRCIYCIHALSLYLFKLGLAPKIQDLEVDFTNEEINNMKSKLEKHVIEMPNFSKIGEILDEVTGVTLCNPEALHKDTDERSPRLAEQEQKKSKEKDHKKGVTLCDREALHKDTDERSPCLAEQVQKKSKKIQSGSPSVYSVPLKKGDVGVDSYESYSFGKDHLTRNRTIMVLGVTGAGKSTLINGMINYILGVEWGDSFRFKLIDEGTSKSQTESQTSLVTVYKINHQKGFQIPYSVTIVDTPGFGDTRGIDRDKMITEQIRSLFTSKEGVTEIDAVCFVTQAPQARLTHTQKYVFDSVLSIFGKDVAENIQILVTFADSQQPPVLEAVNVAGVPCPKTKQGLPVHFKFNNSALFADNKSTTAQACSEDEDDNFNKMFWSMGTKSLKNFFSVLDTMNTRSLKLTKEVLNEHKQLEVAVERIQPQLKAGLSSVTLCDCDALHKDTDERFPSLAELVQKKSKKIQSGSPSVYSVPLKKGDVGVDLCGSYSFGKDHLTRNRTIMVLGATGAGKSTLINGMINYILGVEWGDSFRFKLIDEGTSKSQAESQTSLVTVYKINHQNGFQIPYSVTIVDTPGFGDTRGIDRDKMITEQIRSLFTSKEGVTEIDAVCFVTQASQARLTHTQKYVFDSVLSIFGKDVAENIQMLVTFADSQQPPVLEAVNVAGVPCPKTKQGLPVHFKFNNSALFADNESATAKTCSEDEDFFEKMFWSMGTKSFKRFFSALDIMNTKSLKLTKEVLDERKQLEVAVEGIQPQLKAGLAKLEEIRKTQQIIQRHEAEISTNEKFEIEVDVIKPKQIAIPHKQFITNCQQCSVTCHEHCAIANDEEKHKCAAMDRTTGNCIVCPGNCIWSVHFNQKYKWEYVHIKEKRTIEDLKEKYQKATKAKMTVQDVIKEQEKEIEALQDLIVSLLEETAKCLARLKEIALRPNPLSTPEYIDLLIKGEKSEAKAGYMDRIRSLETLKEQATIISKVSKRQKLSRKEQEKHEVVQAEKKSPVRFQGFLNDFI